MCDLARDCRLLVCQHCKKTMKQVAQFLEHLPVHGPKRYSCGLCNHQCALGSLVRKHMKTCHRVAVVEMLPVNIVSSNSEDGRFIFFPKDMVKRLVPIKSKSAQPNEAADKDRRKKNIYTCKEKSLIPVKSLFPFNIECAHCGYATKVRANMIRHLNLHEQRSEMSTGTSSESEELTPRVVIPYLAPVNPVPHLEGKEKMFDKMANLAYSSHATGEPGSQAGRMTGKMSGASSGATRAAGAEDEDTSPPVQVADHQRYVCGIKSCAHLTTKEGNLRCHLRTLHKDLTFCCPHCPATRQDTSKLSLEGFLTHLKMHGPRLYKCGHCPYLHCQLQGIERHLGDKHPNRPPWQVIIREPEEDGVKRNQGKSEGAPWHCSLCKHAAPSCEEIAAHAKSSHGVKSQFKCALCPVRCDVRSEFEPHFASRHPNMEVRILAMYYRYLLSIWSCFLVIFIITFLLYTGRKSARKRLAEKHRKLM